MRQVRTCKAFHGARSHGSLELWLRDISDMIHHPLHGPRCVTPEVVPSEAVRKTVEKLASAVPQRRLSQVIPAKKLLQKVATIVHHVAFLRVSDEDG